MIKQRQYQVILTFLLLGLKYLFIETVLKFRQKYIVITSTSVSLVRVSKPREQYDIDKYIYLGELFPMMRRTFKFFVNTYVTYSTVLSLLNCMAMHQDVPYFIISLYLTQDDFANASS